jgi:acetolactate synthase-1/2/3 large subunit
MVEEDIVRFPTLFHPDTPSAPAEQAVSAAIEMLARAERPVILAGRGVWFAHATDELREFAELTSTPVCANGMTRGAVPEDSRLGLGSFMVAGRWLPLAGTPDLVLLLGAREGLFTGGRHSIIPADAKLIHVDISAEEIGRARAADLGIVADGKETLKALIRAARGKRFPERDEWLDRLHQAKEAAKGLLAGAGAGSDKGYIHPFQLAQEASAFVESEGVLVADGGETFVWAELALCARRPGRYLGHGYLGCLGTGIPFGLGAKLAHPDERVLVITGDGSVGLNFTEFDTAVRHNLPIVVVVSNDAAWGMCKHGQQVTLGNERVIGTELDTTHYEKAAEAFNVHAEFVQNGEEIAPAIERAFASGRTACVNVMTDPNAVSPAVQSGGLV